MPYEPELDKKTFNEEVEFEKTKIAVSVFSYNGGTPKLQVSRENPNAEGEFRFAKLGRLTKEELEKILPIMEKAKQVM